MTKGSVFHLRSNIRHFWSSRISQKSRKIHPGKHDIERHLFLWFLDENIEWYKLQFKVLRDSHWVYSLYQRLFEVGWVLERDSSAHATNN